MSLMTGAEIVVQSLLKEKVKDIFGYPGGAVLPIYDVLYDSPINHYLTRHEQGAIHAADGYARSTGEVGVCIATSGPGSTNLVTGLATAYMDSVPVVAFTGQVTTNFIGKDAFQEADIRGITIPITKHNYLVTDIQDLARTIKEAFYLARTGRPGPVLIDIPKDITRDKCEFVYPDKVELPGYDPTYRGHKLQINKAAHEINKAEKPVIFAGGGVIASEASTELRKLVKKSSIPITTSLMGLGIYPENDFLSLGMPGMHGTRYANYAISEADLLVAVGVRFDDRVTGKIEEFAPDAKIIHIDIDPAEICKNVEAHIPIVGDARNILKELLPLIEHKERGAWLQQIKEWKEKNPLKYEQSETNIKPQYVIEKLYELTGGEAIISTEVGQNQMWAAQYYKYSHPRTFLSSGGLGTMGYGFPAAIGAQVGNPDRVVIDIAGDGSIQMNIQELATVSNYNLPVKIIILNNSYLGMVRQWQELFYDKRYSSTGLKNPDFIKLAEAYGVYALKIDKKDEVKPALEKILSVNGPALLDVRIEEEENVFPMVPQGAGIKKMIGG
ncbi:biosynthetic-type acetolactate synthase large subunit [Halothermothrix orenii]|uniref:Acetolactate synthase n=1 Tax=Halothermothrix orenii (strain H 168 / OCM 544 / DSM 9562) TaxID=373903 RepID=B8CX18_HALOH|nr:biosynthetic-type acetolactate synthase large subunit [Halothermothrix orenii]ACL69837.1 acetolactate synthase, large subunit, biosynthetic type [Halothermothrix orenii H 168]